MYWLANTTFFPFQLEQMDLEVLELAQKDRQKYQTRLKSYKTELQKLEKEAVSFNCIRKGIKSRMKFSIFTM